MMGAGIVFAGENVDNSGAGTIKICCMHDPYDLRCPVCGHSLFEHLSGATYACASCGVQVSLFDDPENCRVIIEVQGA